VIQQKRNEKTEKERKSTYCFWYSCGKFSNCGCVSVCAFMHSADGAVWRCESYRFLWVHDVSAVLLSAEYPITGDATANNS